MLHVIGCITQQHDLRLVLAAALLCLFACATAMGMIMRARATDANRRWAWLAAAGFVAGSGIWATHFVAMLAFHAGLPIAYDEILTATSAAVAITLCAVGFGVALERPLVGGALAGVAISAMHYIGMAGVHLAADKIWDLQYVAASVLIGVGLTAVALWFALRGRSWSNLLGGAAIFAVAIVGMHFTGMSAITYFPDPRILGPDTVIEPF
jgi:NO-binding membrane sensor protein with MHYT domain